MSQNDYLESFACTSVGRVRKNNEDAALMMKEQRIFVVADGMGGGSAGEIASLIAITEVEKLALKARRRPAELESAIIRASYAANGQIKDYAIKHSFDTMGTTIACLLFNPWYASQALALHAGDSRVYRYREKNLELLTKDHSLNPNSNVITNALGKGNGFYLDITSVDVQRDDLFVVCSDGLSHMVNDREISAICKAGVERGTPETISKSLLNRALEKGGKDNVTIIVIRVQDLPKDYEPSDQELEEESAVQRQNIRDLSETPPTIR